MSRYTTAVSPTRHSILTITGRFDSNKAVKVLLDKDAHLLAPALDRALEVRDAPPQVLE